ncbi:MAG: AAA family ATPase, partial [Planctomycetaceae bacterium]|nr:AAA family ATPase [Planctomycetaceae bacterium]
YIDWRAESDSAWQQLPAALKPGAAPQPEVPEDQWNPFDPYTPALGSSFVGRTDELRRMQQAMETGHSLSVVGDWRIGKTSLLAAFAERARAAGRVVRQLSGEGPEGGSVSHFVTQVTGRAAPEETEAAADQLSEWAAANARGGMRPVLIVDEVERLIAEFPHRFLERIRGMLNRVMVVLCSRRELDLIYQDRGLTSPFNNTLELVRVGLLDDPAVEALLKESTDILSAEDVSTLREWAGLHPYFLQLYGHELTDARLHQMPTDSAFDRFYAAAAARFRELWCVLGKRDREDLHKLVEEMPVTRHSLRQRGLVTSGGQPFGRILLYWLTEEQP